MRALRVLVGAAGVVLIGVGLVRFVNDDFSDLVSTVLWLAGGVVAHDAVIAPLVVVAGALVVPRLPERWRAATVAGLVVLLSVTLMAVPVLGRFGAKPDDPWLLGRPYGLLWLGFAVLVGLVVTVASLRRPKSGRIG